MLTNISEWIRKAERKDSLINLFYPISKKKKGQDQNEPEKLGEKIEKRHDTELYH